MRTIPGFILGLLVIVFATPSSASGIWGGKKPEHLWSKGLGGFGVDVGRSVAVDAAGNVVVVGYFQNAVDFGGGTLVSAGYYDIFVAKYNASGAHLWSKRFGGTDSDSGASVAVDGSGNIFVLGGFQGAVDFGGGNLVSTGFAAIFLAKYSASGAHLWSQRFESTESTSGYYLYGLAVDGSGNVVVNGGFKGTMDLGGGNLVSAGGFDTFLAKYSASGALQWSKRVGNTDDDFAGGPSVDGSGNVFVTGSFQGTVNVGGGNLVSAGGFDTFLAKYNASGAHQWSRRLGSTDDQFGVGLAVDGPGNVVVTGNFNGTVDFGGGNLVSAGDDIFLAKYTPNGVHVSERFGTADIENARAVAVDALGNVVLIGVFDSTVNFGGGNLVSAGNSDIFLAKFNEYGGLEYSRSFGDTGSDAGNAVGVDASGNAVVVGHFTGTVDFGGGAIAGSGGLDIFVAKYGNPPGILHIADFPADVGKVVGIHFMSSAHDVPGLDPLVTQYQAFRWTDTPSGPGWEIAAEIPATLEGEYVMNAPTDADSTCASGQHWSKFFIRAMTSDPAVFFDSDIDSGYSVDNLPPGIPGHLAYMSGQLTWDPSNAPDFDHFTIYGSNTNSFAAATLVDYTGHTEMNVASLPYRYYFVTATDHSCNEGNPASIGTVTGVGGTPTSYVLSVSAYPNPFNPETTIRYTLPSKGRVTIDVFDARGAHVAKLVDAVTPRGAYTVTWNGHDDRGNAVSSGVFFARLTSPAGARSYKMTLLK